MTKTARYVLATIAAALFVVIVVMLAIGPRFTASGASVTGINEEQINVPDVPVTCAGVLSVGWPTDNAHVRTSESDWTSTSADLPTMPATEARTIRAGFEQECNQRRDTAVGWAVLLSFVGCMLGSAAIAGGRPH